MNLTETTDAQLLHLFSRGHEPAFDALVRRHGGAIKGYALRLLHSPEQAEEIYAETFLRVATGRGAWEDRGTVRSWLFTMAHRLCIDVLRRRNNERRLLPGVLEMSTTWSVPPSPEASALMGEQATLLERALATLPVEHRQVLLLRVVHGLSATECASTLGIREDQVHSQVSYARRRLREVMESPGEQSRRKEAR